MEHDYNGFDGGGEYRAPLTYDGEFTDDYDDEYRAAVLKQIELAKIRRREADKRARDKLRAEILVISTAVVILILICSIIVHVGKRRQETEKFVDPVEEVSSKQDLEDLSEPMEKKTNTAIVGSSPYAGEASGHKLVSLNGVTYVDGILIVNKTFSLPADYDPGVQPEAEQAFNEMAGAAWGDGIALWICSGYRSYSEQEQLFREYASYRGLDEADAVSARPGHSEHQSGLAFDVNTTDDSFAWTDEAAWLEQNCADYGFIIRFPEGKEKLTGYSYEPWHIRYVGVEHALAMKAKGQCLEEYLNVTSDYKNYPDNEKFLEKYAEYADITPDDSSEEETYDYGYGYDDGYDYGYGY